jgi:cytoskeletal protein CcmA (bactofilin family)
MFHRVKPETPQEAASPRPAPQEPQRQQERQPERRPEAAPRERKEEPRAQQLQTPPPRQAQQPQNQTPTREKDPQPMNTQQEQNKDERNEQHAAQAAQTQSRPLDIPSGAYGRPGATGYPGAAYQPNAYLNKAAERTPAASASSDRGSMLTIGSGITMSGEIEACDYLVVEGTVEAALKGARVLEVEEGGVFYGTVEIEEATIAGRFEGDITVRGRLTIRASGTITGSIAFGELEVESGATIDGRVTPVKNLQDGASDRQQSKGNNRNQGSVKAREANKAARNEQLSPANSDGELFGDKAAAE